MTTHVLMITDMSGSMSPIADDVRGGFNSYLDELTGDSNDYSITATLFDHEYLLLCTNAELEKVPRLDRSNYRPRGRTALFDAVGRTIADFELRVTKLDEDDKVLLVIQTDGFENDSKEFNTKQIKQMLDERQKTGKWFVIYIGAGVDSWRQAESMGLTTNSYVQTSGSKASTHSVYRGVTMSTRAYASGQSMSDSMDELRDEVKDK